MARKTLQEKKLADRRLGLYNFRFEQKSPNDVSVKALPNTLTRDLQKIVTLTIVILLLQFALFFVLKNKLLSIPGLSY